MAGFSSENMGKDQDPVVNHLPEISRLNHPKMPRDSKGPKVCCHWVATCLWPSRRPLAAQPSRILLGSILLENLQETIVFSHEILRVSWKCCLESMIYIYMCVLLMPKKIEKVQIMNILVHHATCLSLQG